MSSPDWTSPTGPGDQQWQAVRYVLGEMPAAEAEAFEQQLASDQATRERVAWAAALVTDVYRAEEIAPVSEGPAVSEISGSNIRRAGTAVAQTRRERRLSVWAAAAAVTCVLLAFGLHRLPVRVVNPGGVDDRAAEESGEFRAGHLVAIWSERLSELDPSSPELAQFDFQPGDVGRDDFNSGPDDAQPLDNHAERANAGANQAAADDFQVPGWLMAAVSPSGVWNLEN